MGQCSTAVNPGDGIKQEDSIKWQAWSHSSKSSNTSQRKVFFIVDHRANMVKSFVQGNKKI